MKYYLITATDNHSDMNFVELKEAINGSPSIKYYIPPYVPRIVEEWNRKYSKKASDAGLHSEAYYTSQGMELPNKYIEVKVKEITQKQYDGIYKNVVVQNAQPGTPK